MKSLFVRLYLTLLISFLLVGWGIDKAYQEFVQDDEVISDLELHKGSLFLLNRELSRLPLTMRQPHLAAISQSFAYPISIINPDKLRSVLRSHEIALTDKQLAFLENGGIVSAFNNDKKQGWFMQSLNNSQSVIVIGPVKTMRDNYDPTLYSLALFISLAAVVLFLVWPLSRGLLKLNSAAEQLGQANFDVNVSDNMYPPLQNLASTFDRMALRIQQLIKSHKELTHGVSHELRTPISRIRFAAEMALSAKTKDKRADYFKSIDKNIEALDDLVEELLVYARFDRERPELNLQKVNIYALCEDLVAQANMNKAERKVQLQQIEAGSIWCNVDTKALTRAIDNIVRNAFRFAKDKVVLEISANQSTCLLKISDDGPGIPVSERNRLFEPFVRLTNEDDEILGGLGLGLSISKKLIELHDGNILVTESQFGGACFSVVLPRLLP